MNRPTIQQLESANVAYQTSLANETDRANRAIAALRRIQSEMPHEAWDGLGQSLKMEIINILDLDPVYDADQTH